MTVRVFAALAVAASVAAGADVPRKSPELAFNFPDGKPGLLSQYRGKLVAVEFMLTTCPHCQKASAVLEKMYKEFGARGFLPIGLAIDFPQPGVSVSQRVAEYKRNFGITYPMGYVSNDGAMAYLQHPIMVRMLVPSMVFVDRNGVIQAQYPGGDAFFDESKEEVNMRAEIEKLLKEGSAAKKGPAQKAAAKKKSS